MFLGVVHLNQNTKSVLEFISKRQGIFGEGESYSGRRAVKNDDTNVFVDVWITMV